MKAFLSERNIVVVLFVMVLITFSMAQEDTKKMEKMYSGANSTTVSQLFLPVTQAKTNPVTASDQIQAKAVTE